VDVPVVVAAVAATAVAVAAVVVAAVVVVVAGNSAHPGTLPGLGKRQEGPERSGPSCFARIASCRGFPNTAKIVGMR
jgi:hypothetical protein